MRHGALFNGIGGFQLAAHWMGWENVFHCEIDKFCNQVVKKHFPESICYEDIKKTDFTSWRGAIDILTGGFPCQPYSSAGKRLGKEDERHLWPEMLRAIREVRPGWVVGENVRGLTNWNGGVVFDEVQSDLEAEGYEVLPFLLPAAGVNAPHQRYRIWFVGHAQGERCGKEGNGQQRSAERFAGNGCEFPSSYSEGGGRGLCSTENNGPAAGNEHAFGDQAQISVQQLSANAERISGEQPRDDSRMGWLQKSFPKRSWSEFPIESPVRGRDDGISDQVDRLKSLGNAIVPQVALEIFKAIEACEIHSPLQS